MESQISATKEKSNSKSKFFGFGRWGLTRVWVLVAVVLIFPLSVSAFSLVPCGGTEQSPCQFKDLVILIVRLINYLMTVAAIVAMYHILLSGWNLITAMGNSEKVKNSREGITQAIVGFAIVVLAFVFVNLLVNGLFGHPNAPTDPSRVRKWWDVNCLYNPAAANCPFSPDNPINRSP